MAATKQELENALVDALPASGEIEFSEFRNAVMQSNPRAMSIFHDARRRGVFDSRVVYGQVPIVLMVARIGQGGE